MLGWALCIIYHTIQYNTSRDSTPFQLHFNLIPLLSFCILYWVNVWYHYGMPLLCPADFDISGSHGESITTQCLSLPLLLPPSLYLSVFLSFCLSLFLFSPRPRAIEYSVILLRIRRPRSLLSAEASCSCIRWNSVINQIKMSCLLTAPPWIYGLLFQWIYCIIMYGYEYYMEPHTECMVRCLIAEFNY